MNINISPDQNTVTVTDGSETKIFEFEKGKTFCPSCDLDKKYCTSQNSIIFPCYYGERKDKRNGIFKLQENKDEK